MGKEKGKKEKLKRGRGKRKKKREKGREKTQYLVSIPGFKISSTLDR